MSEQPVPDYYVFTAVIVLPSGWWVDGSGNPYKPAVGPDLQNPGHKVPPDQTSAVPPPYTFYPPSMNMGALSSSVAQIDDLIDILHVAKAVMTS